MKRFLELKFNEEYRRESFVLKYDRVHNVAEIEPIFRTKEEFDRYFLELCDFCENTLRKKVYALVDMKSMNMPEENADYLGERRTELARRCFLASVRYGGGLSIRMTIRFHRLRYQAPTNIYQTREEAIEALEAIILEQESEARGQNPVG